MQQILSSLIRLSLSEFVPWFIAKDSFSSVLTIFFTLQRSVPSSWKSTLSMAEKASALLLGRNDPLVEKEMVFETVFF